MNDVLPIMEIIRFSKIEKNAASATQTCLSVPLSWWFSYVSYRVVDMGPNRSMLPRTGAIYEKMHFFIGLQINSTEFVYHLATSSLRSLRLHITHLYLYISLYCCQIMPVQSSFHPFCTNSS